MSIKASRKYVNNRLVSRLREVFGNHAVHIEKPGQTGQFAMTTTGGSYKLVKKGSSTGEEYRINCPFCSDTKQRLYINHLWGTRSVATKRLTLWLAHCFNEECLTDFENRKELYDMVYNGGDVPVDADMVGEEAVEEEMLPIEFPGLVRPLTDILRTDRDHKLIHWCLARGYDPAYLAEHYDIHHVSLGRSTASDMTDRLLAPIYADFDGEVKLAAWTARRLEDSGESGPKWKHSYGTIGNFLYGIEHAQNYETIVITEGPGDAWSVGLNAVAVLGKTLQKRKCDILRSVIGSRDERVRSAIVLLLDPAQDETSKKKGLEHHMTKAYKTLMSHLTCPILPVYLPSFTDPGSLDRDFIWACIYKTARKAGVYVSTKLVG